ncbi:MAG: hypothetical protein NUV47_01230 [Patescibacteria group bacterium]|nr:hypothetical protein [Patescibacteria group bacterium]
MNKNKKISCDCNIKDSMLPMHICTCITIYIKFKYKNDKADLWIDVPFDSELFKNDPKAAGKFIEKLERIAKKKLLDYTIGEQKNIKNTINSTAKFTRKKS